jgi:hypothetical protein
LTVHLGHCVGAAHAASGSWPPIDKIDSRACRHADTDWYTDDMSASLPLIRLTRKRAPPIPAADPCR